MEYTVTLDVINIKYARLEGVAQNFYGIWGTDDLDYLSRYDSDQVFKNKKPPSAFLTRIINIIRQRRFFHLVIITHYPSLFILGPERYPFFISEKVGCTIFNYLRGDNGCFLLRIGCLRTNHCNRVTVFKR